MQSRKGKNDMKKMFIVTLALLICLPGCTGLHKYTSQDVVQRLTANGLPEDSIRVYEEEEYEKVSLYYENMANAYITVYSKSSDAKKYWENLEEDYDNIQYLDEHSAEGYEKYVCDATIKDWIYYDTNLIVKVNISVSCEWPVYVGDDGEEYYEFGKKVSDVDERNAKEEEAAERLRQLIIDSLD